MSGYDDSEKARRSYKPPHSARNPIPTIQQYRDRKEQERAELQGGQGGYEGNDIQPGRWEHAKQYWYGTGDQGQDAQGESQQPPAAGQHQNGHAGEVSAEKDTDRGQDVPPQTQSADENHGQPETIQDTSQSVPSDPKAKRKQMKNRKANTIEREVTDPVTHLPVKVHDFTEKDMKERLPEDEGDDSNSRKPSIPGLQEHGRTQSGLDKAMRTQQREHKSMELKFPPPEYDLARSDLASIQQRGALYSLVPLVAGAISLGLAGLVVPETLSIGRAAIRSSTILGIFGMFSALATGLLVWLVQEWSQKQMKDVWDDAVWQARHDETKREMSGGTQETALWLSKVIGSIWPLINPDLFTSIADTLEDVMQASIPKLVRMVSVEDIGQGSESLQILGINWLPKGAAGRSVTEDGNLKEDFDKSSQGTVKQGKQDQKSGESAREDMQQEQERHAGGDDVQEGMEAEQGEFVNLELAFAYRAGRIKNKMKDKTKNAHLYLAFYLPGNIKLPVWVELKTLIGICRLRLQLTPDPPFVQLCTLTFLGQPLVDIKCMPLVKKGLNIMDLPLISNFVQSSVNAALSEYVAPKSITLDLQAMLAGDDFKRDTAARGVLVVRIKRAYDFKAGDPGIPLIGNGDTSDAYVSVGWAKFGKPVWSTRVIVSDMEPYWEEECQVLVGSGELDADENLRVALMDSDKLSADDDLGRIEVGLKELMRNEKSNGKMWDRADTFKALTAGDSMPGKCDWSVGYFSKTRLLKSQMDQQKKDKDIESIDQLREDTYKKAERKVRESANQEEDEIEQIKQDDWKNLQTQMISDSLPSEDYPSGIVSIQVHQCVGLQLEELNKTGKDLPDGEQLDTNDGEDSLPDGYCSIILNHQRVFKTRTKPKNSAPVFNACTERFVRDWRSTDIQLAVRDARVHEDDPLIGIVHLSLGDLFRDRRASCINDYFPLAGGIGYGRLRVSIVFRSIQIQPPTRSLGWNIGTLEIASDVYAADDLPKDLRNHRLKLHTTLGKVRMHTRRHDNYEHTGMAADTQSHWTSVRNHSQLLPVERRYASNLCIEFRAHTGVGILGKDKSPACAVLWLCTIPDEEWLDVTLPVWRTDSALLKRLQSNRLPDEKCGEKVGVLKLRVRFWRGLGTGHVKVLAKRSADVRNVVEVLESAVDQGVVEPMVGANGWRRIREHGSNGDSDRGEDDDSDSSDDDGNHQSRSKSKSHRADDTTHTTNGHTYARPTTPGAKENTTPGHSPSESSSQFSPSTSASGSPAVDGEKHSSQSGPVAAVKDYIHNAPQLHRRHRGLMQWKGARTVAWMKHKADKGAERVKESFEHKGREPGVETEV